MESDFLDNYQTYTEPLEVPQFFQLWCALSALAAAAQRKIWWDNGLFKVAPNLYVVLVAPPGMCGKSTAMNLVRDILNEVEGVKIKSDSITKEKIIQEMEQGVQVFEMDKRKLFTHSSLTLFANEMSLLIKKGDKDFVSALNSLFDSLSVFRHSTKHQGDNAIVNPYLNILGGTTPDWLSSNIHEDIIEGGLSARTVLVYSDTPKPPNPFPELTTSGIKARELIVHRLNRIAQIGGMFTMAPDTKEFYGKWYVGHHEGKAPHAKMQGFFSRKRIHLIKVAMLIALSRHDHLVIELDDMDSALKILNLTEPAIAKALKSVGRNQMNPVVSSILEQIEGTPKKEILLRDLLVLNIYRVDGEEFKKIIDTLIMMEKIIIVIEGGKQIVRIRNS